jgi:hypothetical protein
VGIAKREVEMGTKRLVDEGNLWCHALVEKGLEEQWMVWEE